MRSKLLCIKSGMNSCTKCQSENLEVKGNELFHFLILQIPQVLHYTVEQTTDIKYWVVVAFIPYSDILLLFQIQEYKFKCVCVWGAQNGLAYIHRDGLGHTFPKLSLFTY